jgi:hypothetical protein
VQDLVRVGVPDTVEQARVGEGALQGVGLRLQRGPKGGEVGGENVESTGVVRGERCGAAHHVQRRPVLLARLGEEQGAARKIERGKADLAGRLGAPFPPLESPGDHQMKDQEDLVFHLPHDPLADTPQARDRLSLCGREGRVGGAEQEWARHPGALEG